MHEHRRDSENEKVIHRRQIDSIAHKLGRWVINSIAVCAIPTVLFLWKDRDEKVARLINLEYTVTVGFQLANARIDNLDRKLSDGNTDIKNDISALRTEVFQMYRAAKQRSN